MTATTPSTRPLSAIDRIVVGIDGSAQSRDALAWASAIAGPEDSEVVAVMAWTYPTAMMLPTLGAPVAPAMPVDFLATSAQTRLDAVIDATTGDGRRPIDRRLVMGSARRVLVDLSHDADLLVVGRTGDGRVKRVVVGSTASYCVRNSECPVAIVSDTTEPQGTITVAVDGSVSSVNALAWALARGPAFDIVAVYSHDEWELDELPLDADVRSRLDNTAEALLELAVAKAVAKAGGGDERVKRQVRQGDPRTTIVEQADPSELLVLGSHGHSGLARWALGSLADFAVHHAPGTVVIWR